MAVTTNAVATKTVSGRREVSYPDLEALVADAERLAGMPVKTLGNWSYAQILKHLSISMNQSIDGADFRAPMPVRVIEK